MLSGETLLAKSEIKFPLCFKGVGAGGGGIRFGVLIKLASYYYWGTIQRLARDRQEWLNFVAALHAKPAYGHE